MTKPDPGTLEVGMLFYTAIVVPSPHAGHFSVATVPNQFKIMPLLCSTFLQVIRPLSGTFFLLSCYVSLVMLQYLTFNF